jgi:hypothetical protein
MKLELDRLKSVNLSDYTLLTQKETKKGTFNGNEYTEIVFHENFQTKNGEKNSLFVYDNAAQELKDLVIKPPKI